MQAEQALLAEKVRLYPTITQEKTLWKLSDTARKLYNAALEECNKYYEQNKKYKGYLRMSRDLPALKKHDTSFNYLYSKAAQNAVKRLDSNFRSFFKLRRNGHKDAMPPRFRSYKYFFCLEYNQSGFKVSHNRITLNFNKHEDINLYYKARPEFYKKRNNVTAIQVYQDKVSGYYYASLVYPAVKPVPATNNVIAFDPGVKTLLTGFNGKKIIKYSSRPLRKRIKCFGKQKDRVQSKIDKCKKDSKNKEKLIKVKHKILRRKNSQINQILHSYANHIVKRYGKIVVGSWNKEKTISKDPKKGKGNKRINRVVKELPLGKLIGYLSYKGAWVEKVDESKTTRTCAKCGYTRRKHVPPNKRVLTCPRCGIVIDRDANASINIYNRYLADVTRPFIPRSGMGCCSWTYAFSKHTITKVPGEILVSFPQGSPRL